MIYELTGKQKVQARTFFTEPHDSLIYTITEGIKARANANNTRGGTGFESATRVGKSYKSQRAIGFVFTTDYQSKVAEAEDKALSRAVK